MLKYILFVISKIVWWLYLRRSTMLSSIFERCVKNTFYYIGENAKMHYTTRLHLPQNIWIGDNFTSGERLKLRTFNEWRGRKFTPQILIGNNVNIQSDCHISAINLVVIEDNVLIASFVYISDHAHGDCKYGELSIPPIERDLYSKGGVRIGKNTWIGEKTTILPGVTIGDGCIIGANSVVTKDIPSYSVACGIPARVIKKIR